MNPEGEQQESTAGGQPVDTAGQAEARVTTTDAGTTAKPGAMRRAAVPVWRTGKPDAFLAAAVDVARTAIEGITAPSDIGQHIAARSEGDRLVTHLFESKLPGYLGWQWYAVLTRNSRSKVVTVNELGLLPSEDSILAPEWVPWAERVRPEDAQDAETAGQPLAGPDAEVLDDADLVAVDPDDADLVAVDPDDADLVAVDPDDADPDDADQEDVDSGDDGPAGEAH